jgi:GGDEF domain-containing protein
MISLKRFMHTDNEADTMAEALQRSFGLLLQALELHTTPGEDVDYDDFRKNLARLHESFASKHNPSELMVITGSLIQAYREYNVRTDQFMRLKTNELTRAIKLLSKAVSSMVEGSQRSVHSLERVTTRIKEASASEDLIGLKIELSKCLDDLQQEVTVQQGAYGAAREMLSEMRSLPAQQPQSTAGVSVRISENCSEAHAAIAEYARDRRHGFVVLFVVDQLDLITQRHGLAVAQEVLKTLELKLVKSFCPSDQLYRWRESGFVFISRAPTQSELCQALHSFTARKGLSTIEVAGHEIHLAIHYRWTVVAITENTSQWEMASQLDAFIRVRVES